MQITAASKVIIPTTNNCYIHVLVASRALRFDGNAFWTIPSKLMLMQIPPNSTAVCLCNEI